MKRLVICLLLLLLASCAARREQAPGEFPAESDILAAYNGTNAESGPFSIKMSLRFGSEGRTNRVTALMWGNNDRDLRLDIMAGIGANVARIQSSPDSFLLYSPAAHKEYYHDGPSPLLRVGVPVPFDLAAFANLLNGRYAAVFGQAQPAGARPDGNLLTIECAGAPGGRLRLDALGRPVSWQEGAYGSNGWRLDFAYEGSDAMRPARLDMAHENGGKCLILVKERSAPDGAYSDDQMRLIVPAGTPRMPLKQYLRQGQAV